MGGNFIRVALSRVPDKNFGLKKCHEPHTTQSLMSFLVDTGPDRSYRQRIITASLLTSTPPSTQMSPVGSRANRFNARRRRAPNRPSELSAYQVAAAPPVATDQAAAQSTTERPPASVDASVTGNNPIHGMQI